MLVRQPQFRNANADVQIFYGDSINTTDLTRSWSKPPGVSHIYMLLIGSGGSGDGSAPGPSGAVTVWYGAAQNVPDSLQLCIAQGLGGVTYPTTVTYRNRTTTYTLLSANNGINGGGSSPAMTPNAFTATGFFSSVASDSSAPSNTTFLSAGSAGSSVTTNYGYTSNKDGYFLLQPIIVGIGGCGPSGNVNGGIGCGGAPNGYGGPGMVLIASW